VSIFDVAGRRVASLVHGRMSAGPQQLQWGRRDDAGNRVPAGVYMARVRAAGMERSASFVLVD